MSEIEEGNKENESSGNNENKQSSNSESEEQSDEKSEFIDEENDFEAELQDAFKDVIADKNGIISKDDLGVFLRKLGYKPTVVELQEMIDEIIKDQQGQITFSDFKQILIKTMKDEYTKSSAVEAFAVFDKDKKGKISKTELKDILLTKGDASMTENDVNDLLDHYIDFDENGEINYKILVEQTFSNLK